MFDLFSIFAGFVVWWGFFVADVAMHERWPCWLANKKRSLLCSATIGYSKGNFANHDWKFSCFKIIPGAHCSLHAGVCFHTRIIFISLRIYTRIKGKGDGRHQVFIQFTFFFLLGIFSPPKFSIRSVSFKITFSVFWFLLIDTFSDWIIFHQDLQHFPKIQVKLRVERRDIEGGESLTLNIRIFVTNSRKNSSRAFAPRFPKVKD